ncbi:MAG: CoA transferase, partial [Chloroflexi bacterium]|nr:CoA transferase [Chloroflexota bacterium]
EADVFVEGFRPGAVKRWHLDYETLREINPRLVYLSLSGYGQTGPYRDRAGHDLNYQAIGGSLGLNGAADGPPIPPSIPLADLGGATFSAIAILAALLGRERTGQGMYLDMALMDAVVAWMAPLAGGPFFAAGIRPQRGKMPLAGGLPCFNVYPTSDGRYLSLAAIEPHLWGNFCRTVGREDWQSRQWDPNLIPEIADLFRTRTFDEWLQTFEGIEACLEPVLDYEETLQHPQIRHRGLVLEDETGRPTGIASPFPFLPSRERTPAPALGAHSTEILASLGYSPEQIEDLLNRKIIKQA